MRTHLDMLRDPELHRQVLDVIEDSHHRAETAVEQVLETMAAMIGYAEDPVLAERAADLRDLAMRLAAGLSGRHANADGIAEGVVKGAVLALPELMPSVVLEARELGVAGFVVEYGTTVSHAAILAKSFGIPVVRVDSLESVRPNLRGARSWCGVAERSWWSPPKPSWRRVGLRGTVSLPHGCPGLR